MTVQVCTHCCCHQSIAICRASISLREGLPAERRLQNGILLAQKAVNIFHRAGDLLEKHTASCPCLVLLTDNPWSPPCNAGFEVLSSKEAADWHPA